MNLESKKAKYEIEDDIFTIFPKIYKKQRGVSNSLFVNRKEIIKYSNKNNKIIEILDITEEFIKTKYYSNWYPLVITNECKIFYDDDTIKERSDEYNKFLLNFNKVKSMYEQIEKEYSLFKETTDLTFGDMTSNNILVNSDITDFRIIDINSIDLSENVGILGSLNLKYVLGYYSYGHVVDGFFDKLNIDKLLEEFNDFNIS